MVTALDNEEPFDYDAAVAQYRARYAQTMQEVHTVLANSIRLGGRK